jgi:Mg-chelatase subunit ChlD
MRKVRVLACLLPLLASTHMLPADQRTENIDMIVAVDKSLSMVDEIGAVQEYFNAYLVDQVAIPGDDLVVVAFYGKTEIIFSGELRSGQERELVKQRINEIRANGRYTDIGGALDAIREQFDARAADGRKKFVLLITDGIQEAPPESPYYSKDGTFNHAFLENAKTIQKEGWKVQVLGIGTVTAGEELSKELSATYQELPRGVSLEAIKAKTAELFGTVEAVGGLMLDAVGAKGSGAVSLTLSTRGYTGPVKVEVAGIRMDAGSLTIGDVLQAPWPLELPAEGSTAIRIPIALPDGLAAGTVPCTVSFSFSPGERFTPTQFSAILIVPGWLQLHWLPFAIAAVVAVLLLAALILILIRIPRNRPVAFALTADGKPVSGSPVRLGRGQSMCLLDEKGGFLLSPRRAMGTLAVFSEQDGRLTMKTIRKDRFPKLGEPPQDVLGWSFMVKSASGKTVAMEISRPERV